MLNVEFLSKQLSNMNSIKQNKKSFLFKKEYFEIYGIKYKIDPLLYEYITRKDYEKGVVGSIGSGKTTASILSVIYHGCHMPACTDGIRRSRFAVIRNTYPELRSTTIKSFEQILQTTAIQSSPIRLEITDDDLSIEFIFLSVDSPADMQKLLSLEITGAYLNEARELPGAIFRNALSRVGRYPSQLFLKKNDKDFYRFCISDTNAPAEDTEFYNRFYDEKSDDRKFFQQEPAVINKDDKFVLNDIEKIPNIENLPKDYYSKLLNENYTWVANMLACQTIRIHDGIPIFPSFNFRNHVYDYEIDMEFKTVLISLDFGLNPSALFSMFHDGHLYFFEEIYTEGTGLRQMINKFLKPIAMNLSLKKCKIFGTGDPAGNSRSQTDENTCFLILEDELTDIPFTPAITNLIQERIDAVSYFLNTLSDDKPMLQVHSKCKMLRGGFDGGYKRKKTEKSDRTIIAEAPEKNEYSHIADAAQYACLFWKDLIAPQKSRENNTKSSNSKWV